VLCGRNDREMQRTACTINILLGNIGTTVDLAHPSRETAARDDDRAWLLAQLRDRTIDALFIHNTNPVHTLAGADDIRASLRTLPLVVALSQDADETAAVAHIHCPDHHPLEHWSDAEAVHGLYGVAQPMIHPLGDTRSVLVSLAEWSGAPADERTLVRETCRTRVHARTAGAGDFDRFWDALVARGFIEYAAAPVAAARPRLDASVWRPVAPASPVAADALDLVLIDTVAMREPRHAHNPWLHELPDPVTKITWENVALVAPATAARLGLSDGDVVRIRRAGGAVPVEAPVLALPGMAAQVVALALGYGRAGTDRFADVGPRWLEARPTVDRGATVGSNAAPLAPLQEGHVAYVGSVSLARTGARRDLGRTQEQTALTEPADRGHLVRETSLAALLAGGASAAGAHGAHAPAHAAPATTADTTVAHGAGHAPPADPPSMWPEPDRSKGHRWAMAIDLTACTGCSACVVACQVENNIPVVGRDEVRRNREMHWLRIDRYIDGEESAARMSMMPMLCQQCAHAPCETVCPVLATVHSEEGLNQQVYNRCVGTRYCANNCPYKMRRFNWFDYAHADVLANLVLNPDVTVRERGVMEKCTFCVQRIEQGKIAASRRGTPMADGEINTACAQSCPADAIVFGDINDPHSRVAARAASARSWRALEELNVRPSVHYATLVRNTEGDPA
jgi:Fe-S-cluster-containing dehydrogenase component